MQELYLFSTAILDHPQPASVGRTMYRYVIHAWLVFIFTYVNPLKEPIWMIMYKTGICEQ